MKPLMNTNYIKFTSTAALVFQLIQTNTRYRDINCYSLDQMSHCWMLLTVLGYQIDLVVWVGVEWVWSQLKAQWAWSAQTTGRM